MITYAYDPTSGNLTTINAPSGQTLSFGYDGSLPILTTSSGTVQGSVARTYDQDFALASRSINGANAVSFTYDQDKLLTQVGDEALTRDPSDGLLTATSLGTVSDALTYSNYGELASYTASIGGSTIYNDQYTSLDALSRIVEKVQTINGVSHTYDYAYNTAGQLTGVSLDGSAVAAYTYDGNGNRLSAQSAAIGSKTCAYDAQDRLTSCNNGESYTYTANGELLTKTLGGATTSYQYDVLGNLLSATLPGGTTTLSYVVDSQGRRVGKMMNGVLTQGFLYDGQIQVVAQLDGNNNVVSQFVYGARTNVPDYMINGGVEYRIITDNLGSPRLIVNSQTGAIVQEMDYDEFGNVTNDTNPGFQPFGFAGGIYDPDLKLVRLGARDYDPDSGRWTGKDPIAFHGDDLNLYGYVLDNPINLTDPEGLYPSSAIALAKQYLCAAGGDSFKAFSKARAARDAYNGGDASTPEGQDLRDAEHYLFAYNNVANLNNTLPPKSIVQEVVQTPPVQYVGNMVAVPAYYLDKKAFPSNYPLSPAGLDEVWAGWAGANAGLLSRIRGKNSCQCGN